ncbi:MAG: STAS domain-containing protein [Bryobacteraceae bacterium]|jgi:anti-anti-sigma factor
MNKEVISQEVSVGVVQPEGDLVAAKLPALRSKLQEMVGAGVRRLTVDLTMAQMVDSAGIGLLISAHNSLKKAGGELAVINASCDILALFQAMRIHQHFSVTGN